MNLSLDIEITIDVRFHGGNQQIKSMGYVHMMNAYLNVHNYFKRTSTTNCEIKTSTGSLQISPNITQMIWLNNSVNTTLKQS